MGLGLSVSKTIVEKLGGEIEVDSTENVGTTVRVHLRRYTNEPARPAESAPAPAITSGPRARVLVVDDEPIMGKVLERILAEEHDVTVATNGAQALSLIEQREIDVILCDVMMPGMNGDEVHRRLAARRPDLAARVVFMSGGALGTELEQTLDALPNERLAKPFKIDDVLALVARYAR
jgi:CheY-like chemotaxis protein